ncbi:hypothetical protein HK103_006798 [Boothiomyces macroporosus]|uniref:VPS9 domain-containing protein n=1 Tax=Boothiomyces macroporosus TaxID=261099 RepID=A0AAD5UDU4_9FUNG|nr:hypothetical protein HK103_006798 [Boothiomyces macroporosus]
MSQTTLIGNEDADRLINQMKSAEKFEYAQGYKPIVEHYSDAESEHQQEEQQQEEDEEEYLLPAYIHLITLGDTIKSIAKHYSTSIEILQRANCITEITEEIFCKRKFIVIPSKSTFNEFIFESEQVFVADSSVYDKGYFDTHTFILNPDYKQQVLSGLGIVGYLKNNNLILKRKDDLDCEPQRAYDELDHNNNVCIKILSAQQVHTIKQETVLLMRIDRPITRNEFAKPLKISTLSSSKHLYSGISLYSVLDSLQAPIDNVKQVTNNVFDTLQAPINNVLPILSNYKFTPTELPIPNCNEPGFLLFIDLLKQPKSEHYCLAVQKYALQIANYSAPLKQESKLEPLQKILYSCIEDFSNKLSQDPDLKTVDQDYIFSIQEGLESYLISLNYDKIRSRLMKVEFDKDLMLTRRLTLFATFGIEIDVPTELKADLADLVKQCYLELLRFETSTTPTQKLFYLHSFVDLISSFTHDKIQTDADLFLSLVIYILQKTIPVSLYSSLKFTQLKYSRHMEGVDEYCIVSLEAAISWINLYDMGKLGLPEDILRVMSVSVDKGTKSKLTHGISIMSEL